MDNTKIAVAADMPVTYSIGSDRYGGKVLCWSKNARSITAEIGHLGIKTFTLRNDGSYREQGHKHGFLLLGAADNHWDPSF